MTLLDPAIEAVDFTRDRWGRPLVVPAGGGKPKPYTRASSAAKAIEDTYNLELWARRNVAFGLARDPSLVARVLAVGGSPHEWDDDAKRAVAKVVEDAATVAQAHRSADIGTAIHRMIENYSRGETVNAGPYQPDLDAYRQAIADMGWVIDPEHVECRMVCDSLEMAGTCDLIVADPNTGRQFIADLKTGSSVTYGGLGYSAQLAAYAHSDLYDPTDDTRRTLDLDLTVGYIVHLPAGQGVCTIHAVDLQQGYAAAQLANQIRTIRKESKKWLTPVTAPTPPPPPSTPKTQVGAMPSEPDEGGPADEAAVAELEAKYVALDPITKGRVNEIATDANRAGVPIHLKNNRTRRRYFIVKALVALAGADGASDNDIRTLIATVLDTEAAWFPAVTVGRCVGALDADQAEHFHLLAHLHIGGLTVIDTGAPFTRFTTE